MLVSAVFSDAVMVNFQNDLMVIQLLALGAQKLLAGHPPIRCHAALHLFDILGDDP